MLNLKRGRDVGEAGAGLLGWSPTGWQYKGVVTVF